jgi:hypothetical protein
MRMFAVRAKEDAGESAARVARAAGRKGSRFGQAGSTKWYARVKHDHATAYA